MKPTYTLALRSPFDREGENGNPVSRILLLLVFLLWMAWTPQRPAPAPGAASPSAATAVARVASQPDVMQVISDARVGLLAFFGFYVLLVVVMRLWSRLLARRVTNLNVSGSLRRFNKMMFVARLFVPAWFGIGLFLLGWGPTVDATGKWWPPLQLPGVLIATLPAFLAWAALWWSQFPAEQSLREHNILDELESDLPVYAPPTFREYFTANLRLQILFTVIPVLAIILVRDLLAIVLRPFLAGGVSDAIEFFAMLLSTGVVFLLAPEILRRVLHTQPLPQSPLRRRLEALCRRVGLRYRDILLWRTQYNMGNAAVMGVIPQVRYILLSDLLLERMDDEQIEAVFAHEVGHIVHRHMAWYVVVIIIFTMGLAALQTVTQHLLPPEWEVTATLPQEAVDVISVVGTLLLFLIFFGFLSRRFERQADVYAARVIEASARERTTRPVVVVSGAGPREKEPIAGAPAADPSDEPSTHVGHYGATVFASALHRVALMNNIPMTPRRPPRRGLVLRVAHALDNFVESLHNWFHGSVPRRMEYVRHLSADPSLTGHFDRRMVRLYCTLLFVLFASVAFVVGSLFR